MICSKPKLADEFHFIKKTFLKNGYTDDVITNTIKYKWLQISTKPKSRPERHTVYLRLPWIDNATMQIREQIKRPVNCCFNLVELKFVLKSKVFIPPYLRVTALQKPLLFTGLSTDAIFTICCTSQRLEIKINQQIEYPNT